MGPFEEIIFNWRTNKWEGVRIRVGVKGNSGKDFVCSRNLQGWLAG